MSKYRSLAVAAALAVAVGCSGGADRGADAREGGGGRDGLGDDARPTPAERTGATGDSNRGGGAGSMGLSDEQRQFVQKASISSQMEVTLGNLAEDKAQNDQIKKFGEQLARDHESVNRELQASLGGGDATTAQQPGGGVSHPSTGAQVARGGQNTEMQQQMQQTLQKLERVAGPAFDQAYLEEIVKHHQQDIKEFERVAQSDNPQIRAFAERTLPTLRQHLEEAQRLQQQIQQGQTGTGRQ